MTQHRPEARRAPPLLLLAFFAFCGTMGMHVFVPALATVARDLGVDARIMQFDVAMYVVGLATGQLIYGPLSDRIGRRPAMMAGVALYTAGGVGVALAPGYDHLIVARFLQALGGSAGIVLPRVMIRDSAEPREAVRLLALMGLIVICGPGLAPILGSVLISHFDWRVIAQVMVGFGVCMLVAAWRILPETRPAEMAPVRYLAAYRSLLSTPAFLAFSIGGGGATTSIYAFYGGASVLLVERFGRPVGEIGLYLGLLVVSNWLGSLLTARIVTRTSVDTVVAIGSIVSSLCAFVFLGLALSGHLSLATTVATICCYSVGVGMSLPAAIIKAVQLRPDLTGSASGIYGFLQMSFGGMCAAAVTLFHDPAFGIGVVLCAAAVTTQCCFHYGGMAARRSGR